MKGASAPLLLFGVVGVGTVLALAAAGGGSPVAGAQRAARTTMDWMDRVIARVSRHEGRHDSLNLNADGAGLSFGIIQWAQKPGSLGVLLAEMQRTDPERFARTFGPDWRALLEVTRAASLAPVSGSVLWSEPWVSRFKAAGRDPVFVAVQKRLAKAGEHFVGALDAARELGVATERSLALLYDTSVQQGPRFAKRHAQRVRERFVAAGRTRVPVQELLTAYAQTAPAHFRRTTPPTEPYPSSHIEWRRTGDAWHAWAGRFDLYTGILRRRMGIVNDPELSDAPVALPGPGLA